MIDFVENLLQTKIARKKTVSRGKRTAALGVEGQKGTDAMGSKIEGRGSPEEAGFHGDVTEPITIKLWKVFLRKQPRFRLS